MELLKKWTQISLIKRILVGMLLGIILGVALPQFTVIGILGTLFVNALKALAPMLVFFIVIHALAQRQKGGSTNMGSVIVLYLVGTFLAALCAVVASFLFPSTLLLPEAEAGTAAPGGIGEVLSSLLSNAVSNPISALANANFIGILLWAVVFGLAMSHASEPTCPTWPSACPPPSAGSSTAPPSASWAWCTPPCPPPASRPSPPMPT